MTPPQMDRNPKQRWQAYSRGLIRPRHHSSPYGNGVASGIPLSSSEQAPPPQHRIQPRTSTAAKIPSDIARMPQFEPVESFARSKAPPARESRTPVSYSTQVPRRVARRDPHQPFESAAPRFSSSAGLRGRSVTTRPSSGGMEPAGHHRSPMPSPATERHYVPKPRRPRRPTPEKRGLAAESTSELFSSPPPPMSSSAISWTQSPFRSRLAGGTSDPFWWGASRGPDQLDEVRRAARAGAESANRAKELMKSLHTDT